jgi:hypothetical protein
MSFSLAATPTPLHNDNDADAATNTPTLLPTTTTFQPANVAADSATNIAANTNVETPTRIQVKRKRSFTPQSDTNNRSASISIETPPSRLILRAKHPLLPRALFETHIVDAPTQAQRDKAERKRKRNERKTKQQTKEEQSLEEPAEEEKKSRTTLVETRSPTPIENIAFYVEKHSTTPDWRKMLMTARRLRSLTERVFPVLHLHTIGVYWVDNDSTTSLAQTEAFDRGRALFFNADTLCVCSDIHLFLVVCRALCSNANQDLCACIEAHYDAFRDKEDASDNDDEADGDDDIKIDIEFEALFEEFAFRN